MNTFYRFWKWIFYFLMISCSFVLDGVGQECNRERDSLALVDLYNATGGEDWSYTAKMYSSTGTFEVPNSGNTWDFTTPISTWHGIKVENNCVTEIALNENNLVGEIPDLDLPNLKTFVCYSNLLVGEIPNFSNVPNLQGLFCWDNDLTGFIPDFSNCQKLRILSCGNNQLSSNIPNFSATPLLRTISCNNNNLSGNIPDFENIINLVSFQCQDNNLSGEIPDFLNIPKLTTFNCSNNNIIGSIPDFKNIPNLNQLNCASNELEGSIPDFTNLPVLTILNLTKNKLIGEIPDFSKLPLLEGFTCGQNKLTGEIPDFKNIPKLINFYCDNNQLSGVLPTFSNLPMLKTLSCNNNLLVGMFPDLSKLIYIEHINIGFNFFTGQIPDFHKMPLLKGLVATNNNFNGCFPLEFLSLCLTHSELEVIIFSLNPKLPWQGDFTNFCNGEPQIGAPCDDNNSNTQNDRIQNDCSCLGDLISTQNDTIIYSIYPNDTTINIGDEICLGVAASNFNNIINFQYSHNFDNSYLISTAILNPNLPDFSTTNFSRNDDFIATTWGDNNGVSRNSTEFLYELCFQATQVGTTTVTLSDTPVPIEVVNNLGQILIVKSNASTITIIGDNSCRTRDSLELVNLYNATDGGSWITEWDLSQSINTWVGVTLNEDDCVVELKLSGNNLSGSIPDLQLENLITLNFNNNQLSGGIPDFTYLPTLQSLALAGNQLTGPIPDFTNLISLRFLNIDNNQLSGSIPDFENLPILEDFDCADNMLTGNIPNFFFSPTLINLDCRENQLTGSIPDFEYINDLVNFYCSENRLTGTIPDFKNLPLLETLLVEENELSGSIPDLSDNCPNLTLVIASDNQLSGCFPEGLRFLCFPLGSEQGGAVFDNNPRLPWQGNFSRFCSGGSQIGAICDDSNLNTQDDKIQEDCTCDETQATNTSIGNQFSIDCVDPYWDIAIHSDQSNDIIIASNKNVAKFSQNGVFINKQDVENGKWLFTENNYYASVQTTNTDPLNLLSFDKDLNQISSTSYAAEGSIFDIKVYNQNQFVVLRYISTSTQMLLERYNFDGTKAGQILLSSSGTSPRAIEVSPSGDIYYYDSSNRRNFGIIDENFNISFEANFDDYLLQAMEITSEGRIFIAGATTNPRRNFISEVSKNGQLLNENILVGDTLCENCWIQELAISNEGKLALSLAEPESNKDYTILCFSQDLEILKTNRFNEIPTPHFSGTTSNLSPTINGGFAFAHDIEIDGVNLTAVTKINNDCSYAPSIIPVNCEKESCRDRDSLALVSLYNATDGANWTNKWDLSQPMDTWFGVHLTSEGCVSALILHGNGDLTLEANEIGNNLSGTIPISIGMLSELRTLNLRGSNLTGELPCELGELQNLTGILLEDNQLSGGIPSSLGTIPALGTAGIGYLGLTNNQLSGCFPESLMALCDIQVETFGNSDLSWQGDFSRFCSGEEDLNCGQLSSNCDPSEQTENEICDCCSNNSFDLDRPLFEEDTLCVGKVFIPNFFEPNGNGFNEEFNIHFGGYECVSTIDVSIYSTIDERLVYQLNGILKKANTELWDGFTIDGSLASGSYYYSIVLRDDFGKAKFFGGRVCVYQCYDKIIETVGCLDFLSCNMSSQHDGEGGFDPTTISGEHISPDDECQEDFFIIYSECQDFIREGDNFCMDIKVTGFTDLLVMQFQLDWDNDIISYSDLVIDPSIENTIGFSINSVGLQPNEEQLRVSWVTFDFESGSSLPDSCTLFQICFTAQSTGNTNFQILNKIFENSPTEIINSNSERLQFKEEICDPVIIPTISSFFCDLNSTRNTLINFYDATNGANWTNQWDLDQPITTWHGLAFDNNGCLIGMSLKNNNLTGTIPPEIGLLIDLQFLDLTDNNLEGTIPTEVGNLRSLIRLDIGTNNLDGELPNSLAILTNLRVLALSRNNFTGTIPDFIGDFKDLTNLYLDSNNFEGAIPSSISQLTNLLDFAVEKNNLSNPFIDLSSNKALEYAIFSHNKFTFEGLINVHVNNENTILNNGKDRQLYIYAPQDSIFKDTLIQVVEGTSISIDLEIDEGVTSNIYTWYKDGLFYQTVTGNNNLEFTNITVVDEGVYTVQVTNPIAPQLTLLSHNITVQVEETNTIIDSLTIYSECQTVKKGEEFGVELLVKNFKEIKCMVIVIDWDSSKIAYNGGAILSNFFTAFDYVDYIERKPIEGKIILQRCDSEKSIADDDYLLFLDFVAKESGNSGLRIELGVVDSVEVFNNDLILVESIQTEVQDKDNVLIPLKDSICSPLIIEDVPIIDCRTKDSLTLVTLYNTTDGANWTNKWDLNQPIETWFGIRLNQNGCVDEIRLCEDCVCGPCDGNNLTGTLPDELGDLSELTSLAIVNNPGLTGMIPQTISNLKKVIFFSLEGNGNLSGTIPNTIKDMSSLSDLRLGGNKLTGNIPSELGETPLLQHLFLDNNLLNDNIPESIYELDLISLGLSENQLTGEISNRIGELQNLVNLRLYNNQLSGNIPPIIGSLTKLEGLFLSSNNLSGCFPEDLLNHCNLYFNNSDFSSGYNFSNNPQLPWQGDFIRFCNGENQIGATCNDGDANTDEDQIQEDCSCLGAGCTEPMNLGRITEVEQLVTCDENIFLEDIAPISTVATYETNPTTIEIGISDVPGVFFDNLEIGINTINISSDTFNCTIYTPTTLELIRLGSPTIQEDRISVDNNQSQHIFSVTENDNLIPNIPFTIEVLTPVSRGDLDNRRDGTFTYTPPVNFTGVANFDYRICYDDCMTYCDRATVLLDVSGEGLNEDGFTVPEAFTPNDDGVNDEFVIPALRDEPEKYPKNELIVINRWGDQVYYAKPYNNNWRGTNEKGKPLPAATYYYILNLDVAEGDIIRGEVTLIR